MASQQHVVSFNSLVHCNSKRAQHFKFSCLPITMENVPLPLRKWIKECIKEEFGATIDKELDKSKDSHDIAQKVIQSKEMVELLAGVRSVFNERCSSSRANSQAVNDYRPQTSMSLASDLSAEEWGPPMRTVRTDRFTQIMNKISCDKPIHVRLAGYEALMRTEITNISSNESWEILLKALRDGIADESQPIFEASLQAHAKLLNGSQAQQDVFINLINAFNALYHSKRLHNLLPTFVSGINFKIFLHEKLFRIMHSIIRHQEESLKSNRNTDKLLEEVIEQFITFLSTYTFSINNQIQTLTILNIVSVLEPKSDWSRKWAHSLTTGKILTAALGKSPALLQNIVYLVRAGLVESPTIFTAYVTDEPPEVNISGETVKTATYSHCLCLLTQLCSKSAGRELLTKIQLDEPFNVPDFMLSLLDSLNTLAISGIPASIYDTSRSALRKLLDSPSVLYDARFHELALDPLMRVAPEAERKIHPHMIDVMRRVLDTEEGSYFMISKSAELPMNYREGSTAVYPASAVLEYTSDLLRQPLSIMNTEHVVDLLKFIGRLFELYDVFHIVRYVLKYQFYPAIAYLYNKMDKYSMDNGIKKQTLDSAIKTTLLKIVSMPLALQLLTREKLVFEELLRGSVEPLKSSWSSNDVVAFMCNAALLPLGFKVLRDLAPHFLTKVLTDICTKLEDPNSFHDPWEDDTAKEFLHVLRLLCLNNLCFVAVLDDKNQEDSFSNDSYPRNLCELLHHSSNPDSPYHCLALLALNSFIHNLDANIYLNHKLDFQKVLLNLQENCIVQLESDTEPKMAYTIDEGSLLRHQVLLNSYYIYNRGDSIQDIEVPDHTMLFSKLPPPIKTDAETICPKTPSHSELGKFLQENRPGLRDTGWVSQARKAHRISSKEPIQHSVLIDLLDQMQKAVPTFESTSQFEWPIINENNPDTLLPEELLGIELALSYAEQNGLMEATPQAKSNLKIFLKEVHGFIKHGQLKKFEGFDWFVATVFIICSGHMDTCRTFVARIVKFPSIIYIWSTLGKTISYNNNIPVNVQIVFSHLLEGIIANELPDVKYALKNNCGTDWWIICNGMISHCFWKTLPWHEIVHLLAICILYPPDYTLYYCASLLHYSQYRLMDDITADKIWPENMNLTDYQCGNHFQLMDLLSKRYRNTTLSLLMDQRAELAM